MQQLSTDVFARLACGKITDCPFGQAIDNLREQAYSLFEEAGEQPRKKKSDRPSPLEFRLLGAFLKQASDPEKGLADFSEGVRVGVGCMLPRVPAVYPRKRKWRLKEQEDPVAHLWQEPTCGADNKNYSSAAELAEAVESQLELSVEKGQAFKLTEHEAREKYGDRFVVAALGAQVKSGSKETGDLTIRLLFDGTHGVPVNKGIRVRDQDKSPAAQDIKRVLRELAEHSGPKFGFKVDVKDAHRLIPISPQDWHLLACRSEKTKQVYINMTGTFGVASAAYWWSRAATAAIRGAHYILGHELASWLLLVADDLAMLIPHGKIREAVLLLLVYLRVMGFPLSWKKLSGGGSLQWVGYEMILKNSALGLSTSRAQWLEGWCTRLLRDGPCKCKNSRKDWEERRSCAERSTTTVPSLLLCTPSLPDTRHKVSNRCRCTSWLHSSTSERKYSKGVTASAGCGDRVGCKRGAWTHMPTRTESVWEAGGHKPTIRESSQNGAHLGSRSRSHQTTRPGLSNVKGRPTGS